MYLHVCACMHSLVVVQVSTKNQVLLEVSGGKFFRAKGVRKFDKTPSRMLGFEHMSPGSYVSVSPSKPHGLHVNMHQIGVLKADIPAYTPSVTDHSGRSSWAAGVQGPASQPVTVQPGNWVMGTGQGRWILCTQCPAPPASRQIQVHSRVSQSWSGSNLKFTPSRAIPGTDGAGYDALSARRTL
jgi:hypothetical protein